jgi:hypothetical protein
MNKQTRKLKDRLGENNCPGNIADIPLKDIKI